MFAQLNSVIGRRQRWLRISSFAFHALLLGWLLHAPEAQLISVSSVALGQNGKSVTRIYWPTKSPDDSSRSSSDSASQRYRHQRLSHNKLTFKPSPQTAQAVAPKNPLARSNAEDDSKTQTLSALGHGAQAGPTYGSLYGPMFGNEVRPALPIETSDPVVYPWQLPDYGGNEVIEITIDERGEIVRKTVLHSLGADIDNKCLAALENWHFHPATRNGAPIPSKQDAIFPFKARG
jgi:outer membrane biosynthesis protein TonB